MDVRGGLLVAALAGSLIHCGVTEPSGVEECTGFAEWRTSEYVLPYAVGSSFRVIQGNCSPTGNGHRGVNRYGYDFDTAIGTPVHAARAGTVARAEGSHFDGQVAPTGLDNYLVLQHADGTFGLYGHFTHDGVFVGTGESVDAGDLVGRSGNTGNTANIPHLHFSVHPCDPFVGGSAGCPSLPVTFRNTDANPTGLQNGSVYPALPY